MAKTPSKSGCGRVPLERALSKMGIASRTQARQWILDGRVKIAGSVCLDPLRMVVPESTEMTVDGAKPNISAPLTLALHKTKGLVTTRSDEKGRPTIYSLLAGIETHLIAVGRLDAATTGLLLLTNDTQFGAWVTDPKNQVPRVYIAQVRGDFTPEKARQIEAGVEHEGEALGATDVDILKSSGRESTLQITLTEGKNREIRRMLSQVGHEVTKLKRISFGGICLGELAPGKYRELSKEELESAFPGCPFKIL
ncbi:pseudouridine synthase [Bdellovibrionota bacterium FG-2]